MASKFQKIFGNIASIAGPLIGGAIGGPPGAAIGGALGGAVNGKGALKNAAIGAGSGYLGAKALGVQGQGFGNLINNPLQTFQSAFGFGRGGGSGGTSFNPLSLGAQVGGGFNVGAGGPANQALASKALTQQSSVSGGFGSGLKKNPLLLGLGTMLGSQFLKSPQVPELPQSVLDFQNAAKAGNPLQNQASQALSQQLGQTQQNLGQPEIDALNRQYDLAQEQELKQIDSMYKSLRPGTDPLTDTSYQKDLARVRDRYATLRADSVAQAQRQISNDFNSQRAQQIAQAAGLGQQQLQQLATLSQYDLDRQLSQLNIDYNDKSTLRNYLLQLGGNLASSAFQPENPLLKLLGGA